MFHLTLVTCPTPAQHIHVKRIPLIHSLAFPHAHLTTIRSLDLIADHHANANTNPSVASTSNTTFASGLPCERSITEKRYVVLNNDLTVWARSGYKEEYSLTICWSGLFLVRCCTISSVSSIPTSDGPPCYAQPATSEGTFRVLCYRCCSLMQLRIARGMNISTLTGEVHTKLTSWPPQLLQQWKPRFLANNWSSGIAAREHSVYQSAPAAECRQPTPLCAPRITLSDSSGAEPKGSAKLAYSVTTVVVEAPALSCMQAACQHV